MDEELKKAMETTNIMINMSTILSRDKYITEEEYLKLYPESISKEEALVNMNSLIDQGVVYCNTTGSTSVYYLKDVVMQ